MMKFLFVLGFSMILFGVKKIYFWFLAGGLVFIGVMFLFKNFIFVDFVYLSEVFYGDMLGYSLILLSVWISCLMYFSSQSVYKMNNFLFFFSALVFLLCVVLILTFFSSNLLLFYFYFEVSLIPTLMIIMGWGYQPERIQAGVYFLFYTMTASLPLLMSLMYIYNKLGSLDLLLGFYNSLNYYSFYLFMTLTMAFLVKMPMFFTHLWLPKAHVEAPVAGSMILAGVLLKLGGYGFYRVLGLCLNELKIYGSYFLGVSIMGMLYVGFMCCRLNDLKALVAYSSVAHMGMVICGIFTGYFFGYSGGLMMMLGHGLASSGLFCIVNVYYERMSSRSIYMNKGLIGILPLMTLFIFFLSAANMAAPPTINLMSEIFLMISILKFDYIMLVIFPLASYMGAVFTLFMFSFSQHGQFYTGAYSYSLVSFREFVIMVLHIIPVNFLILKAESLMFIMY